MLAFDREICRRLPSALEREWLETNGIGGYASSTICGANTRRYHGLLVAAIMPPVGRLVLLSKLEETLVIGAHRFELATNRYPGATHPEGYLHLKGFRLDPFPVFMFAIGSVELEKSVFMVQGENTTVIQYQLRAPGAMLDGAISLELRPLIAFRDYHATTHENGALDPRVLIEDHVAAVRPYPSLPACCLSHDSGHVTPSGLWYRQFEYEREQERGLDDREDLFQPFVLLVDLQHTRTVNVIASTEKRDIASAPALRNAELIRRERLLKSAPVQDELVRALTCAADQFLVARDQQSSLIAGYHWFSDWGRDTMIALRGLTLATRRFDVARSILLGYARVVDRGMLPNRFPDSGEAPEYNTVDATLWYFEAVRSYLEHTRDARTVRELYPVLQDIIAWHERGTRHGIKVDRDGLLLSGEPGDQLTWMDAKIGDWVVTPRHGKPVEVQALWYNALRTMQALADLVGDLAQRARYQGMADRARASFGALFWNLELDCLYDVVDGEVKDASLRPNQILAVSLVHTMLEEAQARSVVKIVERELLTPVGLRTLSPRDPRYCARYEGDSHRRDASYHQGTVWAWLMGPFLTAYVKVHGGSRTARRQTLQWLRGFEPHLRAAGLNQISEIFDADPPHAPRGCIAQGWSVAEILRAAVEDVLEVNAPRRGAATESSHVEQH